MKICMLGSGALGSSIGGQLAAAGLDVYFFDTWEEHISTMANHGLKIIEPPSERLVNVRATTNCREIEPVDLIIILVKSFHTKEAIENVLPIIGDKTVILSLQNGVGNEEILVDVLGKERVIGGKTYVGGVLIGPGEVLAGVKGKLTYIGELDGKTTERINRISRLFSQAGLETIISDNIYGIIWYKLLINVATGALAAITRLPYGALTTMENIIECATEAVVEAVAVAKAGGVELPVKDPREIWYKATEGLPPEFKTSMLQDIEKGSRTEIDYINGSVVKLGEKYNIPTPVNKTLVTCIKGIEFQQKKLKKILEVR
jgi:2-dehydropantoate 2-reductase